MQVVSPELIILRRYDVTPTSKVSDNISLAWPGFNGIAACDASCYFDVRYVDILRIYILNFLKYFHYFFMPIFIAKSR